MFLYIGAILPWSQFTEFSLTPWRLVVLGILVMLVRRLPWVLALSHFIPALPTWRESIFAGFFGPIGVGALFYTQIALEVLPNDGTRQHLRDVLYPVNLFLIFTSIVVHGITIPVAKSFQRARTMTRMSGSKSLVDGGNNVSRLPPAVPLGTGIMHIPGSGTNTPREATPGGTPVPGSANVMVQSPGPALVRFGTRESARGLGYEDAHDRPEEGTTTGERAV